MAVCGIGPSVCAIIELVKIKIIIKEMRDNFDGRVEKSA
jgi:hypothetical protein